MKMDKFTINDDQIIKGVCYRIDLPNTPAVSDAIDFLPTIAASKKTDTTIYALDHSPRPINVLIGGTDYADKARFTNIPVFMTAKITLDLECAKINKSTRHTSEKIKAAKIAFAKYIDDEKDIASRLNRQASEND